jgi:hypothetical protein
MSYNKPEKDFGEAPKVHKIRTPSPAPYFANEHNVD